MGVEEKGGVDDGQNFSNLLERAWIRLTVIGPRCLRYGPIVTRASYIFLESDASLTMLSVLISQGIGLCLLGRLHAERGTCPPDLERSPR